MRGLFFYQISNLSIFPWVASVTWEGPTLFYASAIIHTFTLFHVASLVFLIRRMFKISINWGKELFCCHSAINGIGNDCVGSVDCDNGTYGVNCNETCGHCLGQSTCIVSNGSCLGGCERWWGDPVCKTHIGTQCVTAFM